jgi:hypothetical protein
MIPANIMGRQDYSSECDGLFPAGTVPTLKFVYTLLSRLGNKLVSSSIGVRIVRITTKILLITLYLL